MAPGRSDRPPLGVDVRGGAARPPLAAEAATGSAVRSVCGWPLLVLAQMRPGLGHRTWGWRQIAFGRWALRATPGLVFARSLGSGHDGGFGLRPSLDRLGLFLVFDQPDALRAFATGSPQLAALRTHSQEHALLRLRTTRARGSWGGTAILPTPDADAPPVAPDAPIAALTRASIRPLRAVDFWRHAPPSEQSLERAAGCRLAVGLGEAPLLRQCTFSLWDSAAAMDRYARAGAHQQAIAASRSGGYFSETMFLRFEPLASEGRWQGRELGPVGAVTSERR
jgi:spheroidene monooxygenase